MKERPVSSAIKHPVKQHPYCSRTQQANCWLIQWRSKGEGGRASGGPPPGGSSWGEGASARFLQSLKTTKTVKFASASGDTLPEPLFASVD